ncbi:hypothetical protein ACFWJ5_38085 [Streptomyces qaidamensis]|uniref:MmyB family transcriptional regulator n=1 Tax=Streptomyces qaidamensis TaxID=1783515 RepID=UPI003668CCE5
MTNKLSCRLHIGFPERPRGGLGATHRGARRQPSRPALYTDFEARPRHRERNLARLVFLDEGAGDCLAMLRLYAGRHPDDPQLTELVGELSLHSDAFRSMWADHDVIAHTTGTKRLHHPLVGDLTLDYMVLAVEGDLEQTLTVSTPNPPTPPPRLWASSPAGPARPPPRRTPVKGRPPQPADPGPNPGAPVATKSCSRPETVAATYRRAGSGACFRACRRSDKRAGPG